MMKSDKAILDTSVLICLYQLDLLNYLSLFFNKVRIPRKVEEEFLFKNPSQSERTIRHRFLEEFYEQNKSWFIRCLEYSDDLISIYTADKKIDQGEAEVFAQNQALGSDHIMLLDETNARNLARSNKLAYHGVLFILAKLDLNFKVIDYYSIVNVLREKYHFKLNDSIIKQVYELVNSSK